MNAEQDHSYLPFELLSQGTKSWIHPQHLGEMIRVTGDGYRECLLGLAVDTDSGYCRKTKSKCRSKWPHCDETHTWHVVPTAECIKSRFKLISLSMLTKVRKTRTDGKTDGRTKSTTQNRQIGPTVEQITNFWLIATIYYAFWSNMGNGSIGGGGGGGGGGSLALEHTQLLLINAFNASLS